MQLNAAGQVELKLKTPWRDGTTHLIMSPLELMQRLAALVPRPRLHLIRYHGVLAPNARLRPLELLRGEVDIHTLSRQMGNSAAMIERHYSKLTATLAAERLA